MQTTASPSNPTVERKASAHALLVSLERLAARAWSPLESLASTARSRLPFYPRVALDDSDEQVEVVVEVPGVEADALDVAIDGPLLTIHGARKEERETRGKDYYRMERYNRGFERSIRLRTAIEPDKATALLKNGILQVRLPKAKSQNGVSHRAQVQVRAG